MFLKKLDNDKEDSINLSGKVIEVDARGLQCPGLIARVFSALNEAEYGDTVEVMVTDPGFGADISSWCSKMGYKLESVNRIDNYTKAVIYKVQSCEAVVNSITSGNPTSNKGATMVVFSGDLDKSIASFIIATGAASMGKEVTMFFTFWGLNILRKGDVDIEKEGLDKMFGMMMPKGVDKLKISKMNMAGMGTKMIKDVMEKKNVDSIQVLMKRAQDMGVKFVACAMSMDIMGIKEEELIDGVEIAGVASYLSSTDDSNLNLFI